MQSLVSKGKDVKQAIRFGLELMNATIEEVNVEIVQSGTKGFMGIGAKSAVVKLSKQAGTDGGEELASWDTSTLEQEIDAIPDTSSSAPSLTSVASAHENTVQDRAGKAWVEDGKLYVKDSPDQFPTVSIGEGIHVYKNSERVMEKTVVFSEKDIMEIETVSEEEKTKWDVSMDKEKLHVVLEVIPGHKTTRSIPDIEPAHHISLVAEEHIKIVNDMDYGYVMERLESLGVKQGFNLMEIEKALETMERGTYEVATGKAAEQGENGRVELQVDIDAKNGLKEGTGGKIDFREIKTIPTVDRGKVIAVVHPEVPGKPGWTVTSEPLLARQSHPVVLKPDKTVMVVSDKIIAMESGRPVVEQRGQLVRASILPKLTHKANVNLSSGNIHFSGDVEIIGEIEENMTVDAGGDVIVHRSISVSTVTASNAIIAKRNVVGSELSAGKNNMLVAELGHLLGNMHGQLEKMIAVINQLEKADAFKSSDFGRGGLQPLIYILLEKRFKVFRQQAKKYVDAVKQGERYLADEEWQQVASSITQIFLTLTYHLNSLDRLHDLSEKMKELYEWSNTPLEPDSYITISSALDSSLYCSGDITIIGQGCINTKIHAGGKVNIMGVLRGGEVYGRLGVEIEEAGAESATPTSIAVPQDQTIKMKRVMEGTTIRVGNKKYTFNETRHNIHAKLDEEEKIVFQ